MTYNEHKNLIISVILKLAIMQGLKNDRLNVPRAQMKHQPTFTGEEKCPFFLELEWLLHMMMWGVINTLPAATQPSPV